MSSDNYIVNVSEYGTDRPVKIIAVFNKRTKEYKCSDNCENLWIEPYLSDDPENRILGEAYYCGAFGKWLTEISYECSHKDITCHKEFCSFQCSFMLGIDDIHYCALPVYFGKSNRLKRLGHDTEQHYRTKWCYKSIYQAECKPCKKCMKEIKKAH